VCGVVMSPTGMYSFLTVVPRGLQDAVIDSLQQQTRTVQKTNTVVDTNNVLQVTCWNELQDEDIKRHAVTLLSAKERSKEERRQRLKDQQQQKEEKEEAEEEKKKHHNTTEQQVDLSSSQLTSVLLLPPGILVGSVALETTGQHISVGYNTNEDGTVSTCWSCGGQMAGSVWMQLDTLDENIKMFRTIVSAGNGAKRQCLLVECRHLSYTYHT
jgi:hypothetical protein